MDCGKNFDFLTRYNEGMWIFHTYRTHILIFTAFVALGLAHNIELVALVNRWAAFHIPLLWHESVSSFLHLLLAIPEYVVWIVVGLTLTVYATITHHVRAARSIALLFVLVGLSVWIGKELFAVARPAISLIDPGGYAYPSGHTALAVFATGAAHYLTQHEHLTTRRRRVIMTVIYMLAAAFIAGRLYVNVHWVTDILGGGLLGLLWTRVVPLVLKPSRPLR